MNPTLGKDGVSDTLRSGRRFVTFGGAETYLLFQQRFPLREFCAFEILDREEPWRRFVDGFVEPTLRAAASHGMGILTDCCVWRASPDYLRKLGYGTADLDRFNRNAVERVRSALSDWRSKSGMTSTAVPAVLAAEIGPRGDGYALGAGGAPRVEDAMRYHAAQVTALASAGAELLTALTMTSAKESIALTQLAREHHLPIVVSPTVETDGNLPDQSSLAAFVEEVDEATGGYPVGYMVNCAHPRHLEPILDSARNAKAHWLTRFLGLRANASQKSHAELDNSTEIDRGDILDLANRMKHLTAAHGFSVVGGCCGTDAEHIRSIAAACCR